MLCKRISQPRHSHFVLNLLPQYQTSKTEKWQILISALARYFISMGGSKVSLLSRLGYGIEITTKSEFGNVADGLTCTFFLELFVFEKLEVQNA